MATLANLAKRIKDSFDVGRAGSFANKFYTGKVGGALADFERSNLGQASLGLKKTFVDRPVNIGKGIGDFAQEYATKPYDTKALKKLGKIATESGKVGASIGAVGTTGGARTLATLAGLNTAITGFTDRQPDKSYIQSGLQNTAKNLPTLIPKAGLYTASNPLFNKVAATVGATKFVPRNVIAGLGNVAEDVITSKTGLDPKLDKSQMAASFLTPSVLDAAGLLGKKLTGAVLKQVAKGADAKTTRYISNAEVLDKTPDGRFLRLKDSTGKLLTYDTLNKRIAKTPTTTTKVNRNIKFTYMGDEQPPLKTQDTVTQPVFGGLAGVEVYEEDGKQKVRYNSEKGALGALAVAGIKNVNKLPLSELDEIAEYGIKNKPDMYGLGNYKPKPNTVELKADADSIVRGEAMSAIGTDDVFNKFARWVNSRRASNVEGLLKSKEFSDLDSKGINGVLEFQAGNKTGRFKDLKGYFDSKYNDLQKEGIDFNYKEDYLTQIWKNPPEEVEKVFRSLGTKPSFTKEAIFKNYQEGINAGLTPKFEKISDIVKVYEQATQKAIADHRYFKELADEGMILPANKAPRGWVTVNPDRFPKISSNINGKTYNGNYKAPPEIAEKINNYLGDANFKWLERVADWTSATKNRLLSFGVPKTALNAHGFNILSRNVLASKNPLEGAYTGVKYMLNPSSAQKFLDTELTKAPAAIKNGLTLSTSEFKGALDMPQDFKGKFGEKWGELFEVALFDKMLPALKLQKYQEVYDGFIKSGMPEQEAGKSAAKFTNDVFGGFNWEELGNSRDMQNLLRTTILAPDWARTNINLAKNLPKSVLKLKDPTLAPYRRFLATFIGAYVTMNAVNKLTSGHWAFENDAGNQFNIEAGYTEDGQKRYIRPFGTGADFIRLPVDVLSALRKGDLSVIPRLVRNRLSVPLGVGIGAITDTDYRGQPIGYRGTDKYGNDIPAGQRVAGIGGELMTLAGVPAFSKQGIDYATGKAGGEQALLQAFELPVRYSGGTRSNIAKQAQDIDKLSGKALYDRNKSLTGQVKLSDNQLEAVRSGNTSIQDILAGRESNRAEEDLKDQLRNEGSGIKESSSKVFYYEDGQVKSVQKDRELPELKLTGNAELDKKAKSKYSSAITAKANDIYKMYELGILSAQEAEKQLDALTQAKSKASSSKAKKARGVRVSASKVQAIKVALAKNAVSKPKKLVLKSLPKAEISLVKPKSIRIEDKTYAQAKPVKFRNTLDTSTKLV